VEREHGHHAGVGARHGGRAHEAGEHAQEPAHEGPPSRKGAQCRVLTRRWEGAGTYDATCPRRRSDPMRHVPTALALALLACESPAGNPPPGPKAPAVTATRALGAYMPSPPRAVLTSATSSTVLVGVQGSPVDPAVFDRPVKENSYEGWIRGGIVELDSATGRTVVYDEANGFPTADYADEFVNWGRAAAPVFDLDWVVP